MMLREISPANMRESLPPTCPEHDKPVAERVRNATTKTDDQTVEETRTFACGCVMATRYVGPPICWQTVSTFIVKGPV